MSQLLQMMGKVQGYRLDKPALVKTTAAAEGWGLKTPVPGFNPMSCYQRPALATDNGAKGASGDGPLQWIFSDGMASVSIFVEPFDPQRHVRESTLSLGATQTLTRQLDSYWITLVGEVPVSTLQLFVSALERKK